MNPVVKTVTESMRDISPSVNRLPPVMWANVNAFLGDPTHLANLLLTCRHTMRKSLEGRVWTFLCSLGTPTDRDPFQSRIDAFTSDLMMREMIKRRLWVLRQSAEEDVASGEPWKAYWKTIPRELYPDSEDLARLTSRAAKRLHSTGGRAYQFEHFFQASVFQHAGTANEKLIAHIVLADIPWSYAVSADAGTIAIRYQHSGDVEFLQPDVERLAKHVIVPKPPGRGSAYRQSMLTLAVLAVATGILFRCV